MDSTCVYARAYPKNIQYIDYWIGINQCYFWSDMNLWLLSWGIASQETNPLPLLVFSTRWRSLPATRGKQKNTWSASAALIFSQFFSWGTWYRYHSRQNQIYKTWIVWLYEPLMFLFFIPSLSVFLSFSLLFSLRFSLFTLLYPFLSLHSTHKGLGLGNHLLTKRNLVLRSIYWLPRKFGAGHIMEAEQGTKGLLGTMSLQSWFFSCL